MNRIIIHLSEQAQRAALIAGKPAQRKQEYEIPIEAIPRAAALPWAIIDDAGNLTCNVERACYSESDVKSTGPIKMDFFSGYARVDAEASTRPETAEDAILFAEKIVALHATRLLAARGEWAAEKLRRETEAKRRAEKWAARPLEWRICGEAIALCCPDDSEDYNGPLSSTGVRMFCIADLQAYAPQEYAEAKSICESLRDSRLKREADRERDRQIDRAAWIDAHGSSRLRRAVAENIEHDAIYFSERIEHDAPGWDYYHDIAENSEEPRNPPAEAFFLLDRARMQFPNAKLVWLDSKQYTAELACPWAAGRVIVYRCRFPEIPPEA